MKVIGHRFAFVAAAAFLAFGGKGDDAVGVSAHDAGFAVGMDGSDLATARFCALWRVREC